MIRKLAGDAGVAALACAVGVLVSTCVEIVRMAVRGGPGVISGAMLGLVLGSIFALGVALIGGTLAVTIRMAIWLARGQSEAIKFGGVFGSLGAGAYVHGGCAGGAVFVSGTTLTGVALLARFHHPGLTMLLAAFGAVCWGLVGFVVGGAVHRAAGAASRHGRLAWLISTRVALVLWLVLGCVAVIAAVVASPALMLVFPGHVVGTGVLGAAAVLALWPHWPGVAEIIWEHSVRAGAAALGLILVVTAAGSGSDELAANRAVSRSPTFDLFARVSRAVTDIDRDGASAFFGGGDCAPYDPSIHPGAVDLPRDGIDQNCNGLDFDPADRPSPMPDAVLPPGALCAKCSVLVVTIDTLRYDRVSRVGKFNDTTPTVDKIASRGAWFERAYSPSHRTWFALPALAASQPWEELGIQLGTYGAGRPYPLPDTAVTLAETLKGVGYATGMFTSFYYFEQWRLDQGVDSSINVPREGDGELSGAQMLTEEALAWLQGQPAGKPWYAWLHYFEPHDPTTVSKVYEQRIRHVDTELGRVLAWIDESPERRDHTIIVVTTDHGELLGENGVHGHPPTLVEPVSHIPMVIAVPTVSPRSVGTPISLIDIAPTVVAFLGIAPSPRWVGRAHVAAVAVGEDDLDNIVYASAPRARRYAAITAGWKFAFDERRGLSNLIELPAESNELDDASTRAPAVRTRLEKALQRWRDRVMAP